MNGLFKFFVKRSEVPVEQRNYSKLYLVFAGLLFIGTMWSVLDEVTTRRPWKEFQERLLGRLSREPSRRFQGFGRTSMAELSLIELPQFGPPSETGRTSMP